MIAAGKVCYHSRRMNFQYSDNQQLIRAMVREFAEKEIWLGRLLDLRQSGWRRGLFSLDAHLKNFGVIGERIVLLDPGGLTDRWEDVEEHLSDGGGATAEPHTKLGLGPMLRERPDIADRFNSRWKEVVSLTQVREHWPDSAVS